jgi:hypothetical protein
MHLLFIVVANISLIEMAVTGIMGCEQKLVRNSKTEHWLKERSNNFDETITLSNVLFTKTNITTANKII